MSKPGVNITPAKQDNNFIKKDNRNQNSGNNSNVKDDRRSSGGFNSGPGNQQGRGNQNNANQNSQQHERDRSANRNDNKQFDQKPPAETEKTTDKDDKTVESGSGPGAPAPGEKKFTGRCRLFVGNLTPDVSESEFRKMFEPYGEVSEVYVNTSRGFGFIRLDYRQNAEAAKAALDGHQRKGRILRVRFATHGAALKVKNLHPYVSNELLEQSFSQFGELERCVVIVDDRGKPTGEGIVEFVRKPGANSALRRINEGVFLMGADPKPVAVEPLEQKDEEDGMPEKFLSKTDHYKKEREKEPRFAPPGTFEYEFGMRWKALEDLEKQRIDQIKKDTEEARIKLEDEMQNALYEYQAEQIRQDLLRQQEELRRLEELRNQDRMRRQQELELRRQQDERERAQQDERRRSDMMLSMRQQELARGRGPIDSQGLRGRDDLLMGDRYGDRMSDRITDRMGDRMSDRMGDRMGPGQSGFLWDDKQRGEAGLRGDGGRGRDMRGSGAPPLQPPPVPPSTMGDMARGGSSLAASSQSSKVSPKPLMGSGGFGNLGNQPGNTSGNNNASSGSDNPNMGDYSTESSDSQLLATGEADLEKCPLSSPPVLLSGNVNEKKSSSLESPTQVDVNEVELPGLWAAHAEYKDEIAQVSEQNNSSSMPLIQPIEKEKRDHSGDSPAKKSRCDLDVREVECTSEVNPMGTAGEILGCDSNMTSQCVALQGKYSEKNSSESERTESHMDIAETLVESRSKDNLDPGGRIKPPLQRYLSADGVSENNFDVREREDLKKYLSTDAINITGVQNYLSSDAVPSDKNEENYHSLHIADLPESSTYQPSDMSSQYTSFNAQSPIETSVMEDSYKSTQNMCNDRKYVTDKSEKLNISYSSSSEVDPGVTDSGYKNSSDYKQILEEYNLSGQGYQDLADSENYKQPEQLDDISISDYKQKSDIDLISYKQSCSGDISDMEAEMLDEDNALTTNSPGIYQSYEEGISSHYGGTVLDSMVGVPVAEYNTNTNSEDNWVSPDGGDINLSVPTTSTSEILNDSYISSSAFTSTKNTSTEAAMSSSSPTLTSTHNKQQAVKDDHEGALCTGDQSFKTAAARQSALVPFMQASRSVPRINPSIYAGATMVQGIPGPTIMSTSSVHIAQHPSGATIMRQQTVSAGINGGITQATLMQQQAMPNGAQATAVLQQRTMTNRGQTMVLQQRTMTTGLGGMTQQTVVQQRMAAPNNVAQAVFQANALRQRAIVNQQAATILQQRAIRMAQARVIGNQMLRAQALRGAALLQQAAAGSQVSMLTPGLVRGANHASLMQQLVRQRYMGGPVMPGRGVQMVAGRPVRVKLTYTRETLPMESNT